MAGGATFTAPGPFSNAGVVIVGSGGTFAVGTSDYTQSQGTTTVDGTLNAANILLNGGSLSGIGTIQGDVTNAATVSLGDQPGTLTIQGNYTQTADGVLDIAIDGTSRYGQTAITGIATLDGILNVSLDNGFIPSGGDVFAVLTSDQLSGAFTAINGLTFATGESLVAAYTSEDLDLTFGSVSQQITVTSSPQTIKDLQNIASGPIELATFQATLPDTFSATVAWGDGTTQSSASSAKVWLSVSGKAIIVYGEHTYTAGGSYLPVVTLSGASASAQAKTTTINVASNVSSERDVQAQRGRARPPEGRGLRPVPEHPDRHEHRQHAHQRQPGHPAGGPGLGEPGRHPEVRDGDGGRHDLQPGHYLRLRGRSDHHCAQIGAEQPGQGQLAVDLVILQRIIAFVHSFLGGALLGSLR